MLDKKRPNSWMPSAAEFNRIRDWMIRHRIVAGGEKMMVSHDSAGTTLSMEERESDWFARITAVNPGVGHSHVEVRRVSGAWVEGGRSGEEDANPFDGPDSDVDDIVRMYEVGRERFFLQPRSGEECPAGYNLCVLVVKPVVGGGPNVPLEGAHVTIHGPSPAATLVASGDTDEDGLFCAAMPAGGTYSVEACYEEEIECCVTVNAGVDCGDTEESALLCCGELEVTAADYDTGVGIPGALITFDGSTETGDGAGQNVFEWGGQEPTDRMALALIAPPVGDTLYYDDGAGACGALECFQRTEAFGVLYPKARYINIGGLCPTSTPADQCDYEDGSVRKPAYIRKELLATFTGPASVFGGGGPVTLTWNGTGWIGLLVGPGSYYFKWKKGGLETGQCGSAFNEWYYVKDGAACDFGSAVVSLMPSGSNTWALTWSNAINTDGTTGDPFTACLASPDTEFYNCEAVSLGGGGSFMWYPRNVVYNRVDSCRGDSPANGSYLTGIGPFFTSLGTGSNTLGVLSAVLEGPLSLSGSFGPKIGCPGSLVSWASYSIVEAA